ncbi:GNAT family N-acetyltransferase [Pedobacter nototheniae]|uniref:GNAT family N-acetyltransferase n=1 Tax=Pedobacter nototheniae TaxID=2488994 RepID=UPI00292CAB81|nr:GNAT family N-acetyltransferase [Pedobacter nototheniae]
MKPIQNFTFSEIKNELFRLKNKEMKTNFFMSEKQFDQLLGENKIKAFKSEKSCFLITDDNDFSRLYFIVQDIYELGLIFEYVYKNVKGEISVEAVGSSKYLENIKNAFLANGFYEYSSMMRMSKIRTKKVEVNFENIHLLTRDKKEEIQNLYNRYFNKFVERIPTNVEIDLFISNECAYYFSDNGEIQGFVVFETHGITSHLRYWFVHPDYREKKIGSKLIQLFFNIGDDIRRELFWVIESNHNAIKRYKYFGFVEEDMHNLILINKDKKYEEPNY